METLDKKQMTIECRNMNKIIELAQNIRLTRNLSYLIQELQTMEMDKMFPTKENKYHLNLINKTWHINIINVIKSHNKGVRMKINYNNKDYIIPKPFDKCFFGAEPTKMMTIHNRFSDETFTQSCK